MYIDPNTGGILFQTLAVSLCAVFALPVIAAGAVVVYFVKKKKADHSSNPIDRK